MRKKISFYLIIVIENLLQAVTSHLSIVSSLLLILEPADVYLITVSRSIGGFSHGIAYLTVIIHASEVAVPKLRGMIVGTVHFCQVIGVFTSSTSLMPIYKTRSFAVDPTQTIGYNGLICLLAGLLLALIFNRESPVYLMKKYREDEALETMIRLRSESHETITIRHDFNEFRVMILEDGDFSMKIRKYWMQIIIVVFLKFIFVGTFNMRINNYFLELAKLHFYDAMEDYTGIYLIGARWIVMLVTMFLIDFKRIHLFLTSSIGCGVILLYLAYNPVSDDSLSSAVVALIFQLLAGIAVGIFSDIMAVDAVHTKIKPYFVALTSIIETLLQILLIVDYFFLKIAISSFMTVFGILLILGISARPVSQYFSIIPDTSRLSLRIARDAFLYGP